VTKLAVAVSVLMACLVLAGDPQADSTLVQLRRVTKDITEALKCLHSHLDEEIARHDHADARVSGAAEDMRAAVRKFVAFRILAARGEQSQSLVLDDLDALQRLIVEARHQVLDSTAILRNLAVAPVAQLDRREEAEAKARHDALVKARAGAERAALQALAALPLAQAEDRSAEETVQKAWNLVNTGAAILPLRIPSGKRVLLLQTDSYRMAMTDSGHQDENGRRLFYQEEWVQRGPSVIRRRWRVALETRTGEHILLRRYVPDELQGSVIDLYQQSERNSLWRMEPPEQSTRPSLQEVESALTELANLRMTVVSAGRQFTRMVEAELERNDQQCVTDGGLPDSFRATMFAIRAHLARVPGILAAENEARFAIGTAEGRVAKVERLAAWANRVQAGSPEAAKWAALEQRAETEIDSLRAAEAAAVASLPPIASEGEARFPALDKDTIVRLRGQSWRDSQDGLVRFVQEIWRSAKPMPGLRGVQRTAVLVSVDPKTGAQMIVDAKTTYYSAAPGDPIEEVFDEHAADELISWRVANR